MLVRWHNYQSAGQAAEAQLFLSETGTHDRAILFCPGFPGMGGTIFEQRHAAALVEEGYDLIVLKHKGIRFDGASAPIMVNNAARMMQGRKNGETHIGGGPATIDEWLLEPFAALPELTQCYGSFDVIGNSFGALSALWSLTEANAPLNGLKSLLLYAGAQGIADDTPESVMRIWKPEFMAVPRVTDRVTLNDPKAINARLEQVYKELPARVTARLPPSVALTYLVVAKDEILTLADSQKFQAAIGRRGKIVMDEIDHAWPDYSLLAHDTPNYKTEDLLKLLRG